MIDANGFDRDFYLARNADVAAAGVDPYQHYLEYGWREGRDPNSLFDAKFYLYSNPDVAAAGVDPLKHYMDDGWREQRDPSAAFDSSDYLLANQDVAAAHVNPMAHYLLYGQFENRILTLDFSAHLREGFDRSYYLSANPDVAAAGVDPYIHYQMFGNLEDRRPNALFDEAFYLAQNPDVAAARVDAFQHFGNFGWREGRDPSAHFSLSEYRGATGLSSDENPLLRYLSSDRYSSLPPDLRLQAPPLVIQARGTELTTIIAGQAEFKIDGSLIHVTAPGSLLDGHDLTGFTSFGLERSSADIVMSGSGRWPLYISLGAGDERISGSFDIEGRIFNLFAGVGTLSLDLQLDNGFASINGGTAGSDIVVRGSAQVSYNGGAANDVVALGSGDDWLRGGAGVNELNGGPGHDVAHWNAQVHADLSTSRAVWLGHGPAFDDTLISIEGLAGSGFNDLLLGDEGANQLYGDYSSGAGADVLAGRGGDDSIFGMGGADILIGGRGSDQLSGDDGNDLLIDSADGWGSNNNNPVAYGGEGDDQLVYLLGAEGEEAKGNFMHGGNGSDTYIIDPSRGQWGSVGLEFSQIDGDKLDLSALRTITGGPITVDYVRSATSTPFYGSTVLDLSAFHDSSGNALDGRIVLNGIFNASDIHENDLILVGMNSWSAALTPDLLLLI